jgi:hypothetical protein
MRAIFVVFPKERRQSNKLEGTNAGAKSTRIFFNVDVIDLSRDEQDMEDNGITREKREAWSEAYLVSSFIRQIRISLLSNLSTTRSRR